MTSNQHGAYAQGNTHPTMVSTMGSQAVRRSKSLKTSLSSDCGLQLAHMKLELVVIAGQQTAVNTFSPLAHTARQARRVESAQSCFPNLASAKEEAPKVSSAISTKS